MEDLDTLDSISRSLFLLHKLIPVIQDFFLYSAISLFFKLFNSQLDSCTSAEQKVASFLF